MSFLIKKMLKKFLVLLRNNKKKTLTGLILMALLFLYRNKSKIFNYERILARFQDKILKQIEANLKQQQTISKKLAELAKLKENSTKLNNSSSFSSQFSSLFILNDLKEDLKKKGLTPQQKQELWDRFKEETLVFITMALFVAPLANFAKVLKDLILAKCLNHEDFPLKDRVFLEIIERLSENFAEKLLENGLKDCFFAVSAALAPMLREIRVTSEASSGNIGQLFAEIESKLLVFIEKKQQKPTALEQKSTKKTTSSTNYWRNGVSEKLTGVDYNEMGNYLLQNAQNVQETSSRTSLFSLNSSQKLVIPSVILELIENFVSNSRALAQISDESLRNEVQVLLNSRHSPILAGIEGSPELMDEELLLRNAKENEKTREFKEMAVVKSVKEVLNELVDWLESSNFQVFYYHVVKFNVFKMRTRVLLDESKNIKEKLKVAHYLTRLYRITQEEFLGEEARENNESFYRSRVKTCLSRINCQEVAENKKENEEVIKKKEEIHEETKENMIKNQENAKESEKIIKETEEISKENTLNLRILQEYELFLRLEESWEEVLRRVYLEDLFEEKGFEGPTENKAQEGKEFDEIMSILSNFG